MDGSEEKRPLSVLLLARDETGDLEQLIPSLAFAREIVVVWDPRGERATREAAEHLGATVFERELDGFGAQRQFALERCTQDWVLWIDADERLDAKLAASVRDLTLPVDDPARATHFEVLRVSYFLGRRIRWCGWGDERIVRLFRRDRARFDEALVHEHVMVDGPPGSTRGQLEHHSYPTWESCVTKLVRYAHATAGEAWRAGRRAGPSDLLWRPLLRFARQYVLQLGFLDGVHGLVLCALASAQVFLKYAELWDRSRRVRGPR